MKLPILLYKPKFKCLGGTISISTDPDSKLKFGMIRLGNNRVSIYPNTGILLELRGNVTFHGSCNIGNNSYISTWENSHIDFGDNFCSTTSLKLVCYKKIEFGKNISIGWDCLILDTNFHRLKKIDGSFAGKGYGPVIIEENVWIGNNCQITPNSHISNYSVISAGSVVNRRMEQTSYGIYGGNPAKLVAEGFYRDLKDDTIQYD
ncbi:MAG: acyltransferase [Prevotellaceae bacterium]|nr:acyltransferase [Prevotellaceae bacterium]MDY6131354.1 acyltransferase [Prevotella sp.]